MASRAISAGRGGGLLHTLSRHRWPYLFIAPWYLLYGGFMLYPVVYSFWLSFQDWRGTRGTNFIGLTNYQNLIADDLFRQALVNTLLIGLMYVPLMLFLALLLAVVLNSALLRLRTFFRAAIFAPYITSTVIMAMVFALIYNEQSGILNVLLRALHIPAVNWTGSTEWSKVSVAGLLLWHWTGYNMILMLAGLQTISPDLYEAASIDGGSAQQQFFRITVPMMRPVILFTAVLSTIGTFKIFNEPYVLTGGGPLNSSLTVLLYLYNQGFQAFKLGYAAALAYVVVGIVLVLSLAQFRLLRETDDR
jgi:lactose/L-arabinose transport system permease protein